jgi:hypothetical protein
VKRPECVDRAQHHQRKRPRDDLHFWMVHVLAAYISAVLAVNISRS